MPEPDRDDGGRWVGEADPDEVFGRMQPLEPYTTGELADLLDIPRRTAYKYLEELANDGRIRKKKPEPRRAIWIRSE